jgi:hypothetical protein
MLGGDETEVEGFVVCTALEHVVLAFEELC